MIYIVFIIIWLLLADTIWCFIIPIISLLIRAAYRERNIKLFKLAPIIFASLLFIANYFLTDKDVNENIIFSIRIVVFSGLLIHMFDNLTRGNIKSPFIYTGIRIMAIVEERLSDTWLIFKSRWVNTRFYKKPKLVGFTFANFLLESLVIYNQIQLVNFEKGGNAFENNKSHSHFKKKMFQIRFNDHRKLHVAYSTLGDIFLLAIVLVPFSIFGDLTLPNEISSIIDYVSSAFK